MTLIFGLLGFILILVCSAGRRDKYEDVCVGTFVMAFLLVLIPLAPFEGWLRPLTWDARLRSWDLTLGLDGFALARFCSHHPWAAMLLTIVYAALPLMVALNWILERSRPFLWSATLGALLAVPFYLLIPACGPQYVFPGYPWNPAVPGGLISADIMHPRNCFPSMHYAWALLLVLYARNRIWKTVLFLYSVLMIFATVGGGEHYFVDLIAAIPFVFAVRWFADNKWRVGYGQVPSPQVYEALAPAALLPGLLNGRPTDSFAARRIQKQT